LELSPKGHGHSHRGVIGMEAAIVLIAFVIVAAALAFVVLNMGFATTQKAKTSIISSLGQASSSLAISGKVTAVANVTDGVINATIIPIRITAGGDSINLDNATVSLKYISNSVEYDNILTATISDVTFGNVSLAFQHVARDGSLKGLTEFAPAGGPVENPVNATLPQQTFAIIYWVVQQNQNSILERGEHVVIAIGYKDEDRPAALDKIRAELLLAQGATLTIERNVPNITNLIVDLG